MSVPASTTRVSTAPVVSTVPVSTARATTRIGTSIAATSLIPSTTTSRRQRTTTITTASSIIPTVVPYDPAEERQADSHQTNKILIGIFSGFGVILFALLAFQLLRCYKRRYKNKDVPLPPPRESQLGFHSRVSMYKEYPSDFSRPPSMMMRHDGSGSGLVTPSVRSNAPSMDIRADESGRRSNDPSRAPGDISRDDSPDNSLTGPPLVPNDEEMGRRRSPLGSRSGSPANLSQPRPPSQAQVNPRPDPRARTARPTSAGAGQRHSTYGASNRNSTYDPNRRSSLYAPGNRGAPHVRERLGLVMPQPLAPEVSNYVTNTRHDTPPGSRWGSRGNLASGSEQDRNQTLVPPRGPRPDSWVVNTHSSTSLSDTPVSDAPSQKDGNLPRGRDRASRAEMSHP
ncbi:unnamed protein product [Rhizoctonia solani]|uniref:Uncharacterized protein n=1 Tax=Rhizoctonia solani TaxID=456999 RepID=A0A8H3GXD6_9AGAM|nr:unnamed protein product [Rhizoctonia solani]